MPNKTITFTAPDGSLVSILATDTGVSDGQGHQIFRLGVDTEFTVTDITIGAVRIEDAGSSTQAAVNTVTSIDETAKALAVQAPVLGKTADTADQTGGTSSLNAKLRGLVQMVHDVWNSTTHALGIEGKGVAGTQTGGVLTVQGDPSGTPVPITLAENTELGEVKLLDGGGTNVGKIDTAANITEAGANQQAVHDPTIGLTTGTAVITDSTGTLQQYLRGLVKLIAAGISVTLAAGTAAIGAVTSLGYDASVVNNLGIGGARFTSADQSASPAAVTDAPASGKKLVITDLIVSVAAALTVTFTEETTGTVLFSLVLPTGTAIIPLRGKLKLATATKRLMVQTSLLGGINVSALWYTE